MITADTITDEQIRELRDNPAAFASSMQEADEVFIAAMHADRPDREWRKSRARCAEILNARAAAK